MKTLENSKRNRGIEIMLTQTEYESLKRRSEGFQSLSEYVRKAISDFNDDSVRDRFQRQRQLVQYYESYSRQLSGVAANLNQVVKRANELHVSGILPGTYVTSVLKPAVDQTTNILSVLRKQLLAVTKKSLL